MIARVHYISQGPDHLGAIRAACAGGVRWIQLRVKDRTRSEIKKLAHDAREVTTKCGATLIINDYTEIAKEVRADGVHLGRGDMSISEARSLLGPRSIIGATAHSVEELLQAAEKDIQYIGLGPLRFTHTKENLSSVLGFDGIGEILEEVKAKKIAVPVIIIGGVTLDDCAPLARLGAYGVAVASAVNGAPNPKDAAHALVHVCNEVFL